MSKNIEQVHISNPVTVLQGNDLFYVGQTPYGPTDDGAITFTDLLSNILNDAPEIPDNNFLANISGAMAEAGPVTFTEFIDSAIGNDQGSILFRNATDWVAFTPGPNGQFLQTQGAGANVQWAAAGSGTVSAGLANQLGYYAADGSTISGLTSANTAIPNTDASGVITMRQALTLPNSVSASVGVINFGSTVMMNNKGTSNIFLNSAGNFTTTGTDNFGAGPGSLANLTTGGRQVAIGTNTLNQSTGNAYNVVIGHYAATNGSLGGTVAIGDGAGGFYSGQQSVLIGNQAGASGVSGDYIIAIGSAAGQNLGSVSNVIAIGTVGLASKPGSIQIGTNGTHTSAYITGIDGVSLAASKLVTELSDQLGTINFATSPAASTIPEWDANKNISANSFIDGYTTTATAAGTTTLLVGSTQQQFFTGSTTQTVLLPVTSTLVLGQSFYIVNNSSGVVTVQSSGGNTIQAMAANTALTVTCILTSGTTAASWSAEYAFNGGSGTVTSGTANQLAYYAANGNTVSGLTSANTAIPNTDASGIMAMRQALTLPTSASTTVGVIKFGTIVMLNNISANVFVGGGGNFTLSGSSNVVVGGGAGTPSGGALTSGASNVLVGQFVGSAITSGTSNVGICQQALLALTSGSSNIAIGTAALKNILTGSNNTCIQQNAGQAYTGSESNNICLVSDGVIAESNTMRLGTTGSGTRQVNRCFIAGVDGVNVGSSTVRLVSEASGQLGTIDIVAGAGISVSPTANTLTISSTVSFPWSTITVDQVADINNGYVTNSGSVINLTLPPVAPVGSVVAINGLGSGGWNAIANTGQNIIYNNSSSTTGGALASTQQYDTVRFECLVANTTWTVAATISTNLLLS